MSMAAKRKTAGRKRRQSAEQKQAETQAAENSRRAVAMKLAGASYPRIADELGVAWSTAHGYVKKHLTLLAEECLEDAAEIRAIADERLERGRLDLWNLLTTQAGVPDAVFDALQGVDMSTEGRQTILDACRIPALDPDQRRHTIEALRRTGESRRKLWGADARDANDERLVTAFENLARENAEAAAQALPAVLAERGLDWDPVTVRAVLSEAMRRAGEGSP